MFLEDGGGNERDWPAIYQIGSLEVGRGVELDTIEGWTFTLSKVQSILPQRDIFLKEHSAITLLCSTSYDVLLCDLLQEFFTSEGRVEGTLHAWVENYFTNIRIEVSALQFLDKILSWN